MIRLHHIIIVSVLSLLRCNSAWAQQQQEPPAPFETSIVPSDVEGGTLEVPLGQLRQIEFTVTFIPRGIDYHLSMLRNGRRFNVNNNDLEVKRLLSIVSRSCEDSNRPGERCLLLQVTVNGTNDIVRELNGTSFNFVVIGVDQLNPDDTSGTITVRLVDPPPTKEKPLTTTSSKLETTTEVPVATTTNKIDGSSINQISDQCEPIIVETIVPWVFVAVLAALLIVTIVILILVIHKHRNRPNKFNVESPSESNHPLNNVQPSTLSSSQTGDRSSISKDSSSKVETTP